MKKILAAIFAVVVVGVMATPAIADSDDAPGHNKVTICHVTPGQSVTLTIPEEQANGHLTGKAAGHDLNGPVEDYLGECKTPPVDPPVDPPTTPPVPPTNPPGGETPPKDFCPDLEGVQWENYDCNTGAVPPVVEPPVVEPPVVEPPVTVPPVTKPPVKAPKPKDVNSGVVTVPTQQTVPNSVNAGGGGSQESVNWFVIALIAVASGILGFATARLTSMK